MFFYFHFPSTRFLPGRNGMQSRQMRAVSSPSLCDNAIISDTPAISEKVNNVDVLKITEHQLPHPHHHHSSNVSASVLQKFKKTFSQFKSSGSNKSNGVTAIENGVNTANTTAATATNAYDPSDSTKYRFGPLVWRSSKERRKTKHHRRDKCNSGDSGIQVELDNDENILHDGMGSAETSPSFNVRVRRANSAKVSSTSASSSSAKSKVFRKQDSMDKVYSTPLPGRSLSQPYGLDQIPKGRIYTLAHCCYIIFYQCF